MSRRGGLALRDSSAAEDGRVRQDLRDARRLQIGLLPPACWETASLELAALSLPVHEAGGDYFDYFPLSDGQLAMVMADVAGHGLESSVVRFGVRSCVHLLRPELAQPAAALERLSATLRSTGVGRLVTLQILVLDAGRRRAALASAGHPPLLWRPRAGGPAQEMGAGRPPLGTGLPCRYVEHAWALQAGDLLVMHTDGLVEARDRRGQEYGDDRLRSALGRIGGSSSARAARDALLADFSRFRGDARPHDDVSLAVVRIK
jgi:serine phosphatase RsbU (regulator of sigma subunit)